MGVLCFFLENLLSIFGRFLLIKLGFVGPFRFLLIICFSLDFPENRSKTHEFIGCLVKTSFSEEINLPQHHNQSRAQPGRGRWGRGGGRYFYNNNVHTYLHQDLPRPLLYTSVHRHLHCLLGQRFRFLPQY